MGDKVGTFVTFDPIEGCSDTCCGESVGLNDIIGALDGFFIGDEDGFSVVNDTGDDVGENEGEEVGTGNDKVVGVSDGDNIILGVCDGDVEGIKVVESSVGADDTPGDEEVFVGADVGTKLGLEDGDDVKDCSTEEGEVEGINVPTSTEGESDGGKEDDGAFCK